MLCDQIMEVALIWKSCWNIFLSPQELNRLNLESSNGKLTSDLSVSYIDASLISPETGSLLGNTVSMASAASILAKQNKPKSGRSLLGGPAALSPLTPRWVILLLLKRDGQFQLVFPVSVWFLTAQRDRQVRVHLCELWQVDFDQ